ncbi:MAGEL2 [Branchiostoma lanceolatum]|uniref:MAGEL2 protein n=1 Tax=Branchiostoma lanceolatum TaxID=7740 RepID=A0A8K0EHZ5_BRALA|nr:MAGEL2 [Branchiostoma lanceolatum]
MSKKPRMPTGGLNLPAPASQGAAPPPPASQGAGPPPPASQGAAPPPPAAQGAGPPPPASQGAAPPPPASQGAGPPPPAAQGAAPPPPAAQGAAPPPPAAQGAVPAPQALQLVGPPQPLGLPQAPQLVAPIQPQGLPPVPPQQTAPDQSFNALQELLALKDRTERLERAESGQATDRLLLEARAYAARRNGAFDAWTMSALLKALVEAAVLSGHANSVKWAHASTAFDQQLERGGAEDLQSLATAFIGDKEQAAIADTVAKWKKGCGYHQSYGAPTYTGVGRGTWGSWQPPAAQPQFAYPYPSSDTIAPNQCRICRGFDHFARVCPSRGQRRGGGRRGGRRGRS